MGACNSTSNQSNVLSNKTVINDLHKNMKERFQQHTDVSNQKIVSAQELTIIDEIPSKLWKVTDDNIFSRKIPTFKWFGLVKTGEISEFGCNYEISQNDKIEISSIKKDIINDKTSILSTIKQNIKKELDSNLVGEKNSKEMNDILDNTDEEILNIIETKLEDFSNNQEVHFEELKVIYKTPIKCDENGKGPKLTQSAHVDILIHDIINESMNIINKNISKKGLKSKLITKDTNSTCNLQLALGVILTIIVLIFIVMVIVS